MPLSQAILYYEDELLPELYHQMSDDPGNSVIGARIEAIENRLNEYRRLRFIPQSTPIILPHGYYTDGIAGYTLETVIGGIGRICKCLQRCRIVVKIDAVIQLHRIACIDARQCAAVGIRKSDLRRREVFHNVVADGTFAVRIAPAHRTVTIVIQAVARKGQYIGKIAGIQRIGHGDVVSWCTVHTVIARLVGQRKAIDV